MGFYYVDYPGVPDTLFYPGTYLAMQLTILKVSTDSNSEQDGHFQQQLGIRQILIKFVTGHM